MVAFKIYDEFLTISCGIREKKNKIKDDSEIFGLCSQKEIVIN